MDDDDDRSPHDPLLDPDGIDPDDPEHDDHAGTALDGAESPHDGTGDDFEPGDDADEQDGDALSVGQDDNFQAWEVILARRDDAGEWATFGEPVPDARFDKMSVAHNYAEVRNKRDFGWRFDWASNPAKAWLAVREGQRRTLRLHQPVPEVDPLAAVRSEPPQDDPVAALDDGTGCGTV